MWIAFVLASIILFGVDHWTKYLALEKLSDFATTTGVPRWTGVSGGGIPHVFEFVYQSNEAGAMGISFPWARIVLSVATLILLVALMVYVIKNRFRPWLLWCAGVLLIAGGVGNLVDRLFRGYVPDFIRFVYHAYFPYIFNVADIYVCLGVTLLAIQILFSSEKEKEERRDDNAGGL